MPLSQVILRVPKRLDLQVPAPTPPMPVLSEIRAVSSATTVAPPETINISDVVNGYMIGGRTVRKTTETPPRVSVYDLIEIVTGQPAKAASMIFRRLIQEHPEVTTRCGNLQFPGSGQKPTPVTDARGVVIILNLLPGHRAALFRANFADIIVRYMGGDQTLIAEIQRNAEAQKQLPANALTRMFGEDVEAARGSPTYVKNESTLAIESGELMGFDKPGVYFIVYGDKMRYNLAGVPEGAKVIGFGHAKFSGSARCNEHRLKMGAGTTVLAFVPTPFYEQCERKLENRLKAMNKVVYGKIEGTSGVMHEQTWVLTAEEFEVLLRSVQADAEELALEMASTPLLMEREKTKQAEAEASARKTEADASARIAEAEAESAARVAEASTKKAEIEFEILQFRVAHSLFV